MEYLDVSKTIIIMAQGKDISLNVRMYLKLQKFRCFSGLMIHQHHVDAICIDMIWTFFVRMSWLCESVCSGY